MGRLSQISEAELEVMKVLWEQGTATSSQIVGALEKTTDWKPKTIGTLITRLTQKGAVKAQPSSKAYLYSACVGEEEYRAYANKTFLEKLYNGSVNLMLASFVKEQQITEKDLENLKKLLEVENQND